MMRMTLKMRTKGISLMAVMISMMMIMLVMIRTSEASR